MTIEKVTRVKCDVVSCTQFVMLNANETVPNDWMVLNWGVNDDRQIHFCYLCTAMVKRTLGLVPKET